MIIAADIVFLIFNFFATDRTATECVIDFYLSQTAAYVLITLWSIIYSPFGKSTRRIVAVIAVMNIALVATYWHVETVHPNIEKITIICIAQVVLLLLYVVWFVISSMFRCKSWIALILAVALMATFPVCFRVTAFTGDAVPKLQWRWSEVNEVPAVGQTTIKSSVLPDFDYPQFLGPNRNATLSDVGLSREWSTRPPRLLWKIPVGAGWSSFAIVGDNAITQMQDGDRETVVCLDLMSGQRKWTYAYTAQYKSELAGDGPRSTPTIHGNYVFTFGATGILNCLALDSGRLVWTRDVAAEAGATPLDFGYASSPLVVNELVITCVNIEQALHAYNWKTGALVWQNGDDYCSYSSPFLVNLNNEQQVVLFNAGSLSAHGPADGRTLWSHPWRKEQPNIAQPVFVSDNTFLITSSYGAGCALLKVSAAEGAGATVRTIWKNLRLKAKFSTPVLHNGFLYGLDDGTLVCVDAKNGKRMWRQTLETRCGHGQLMLVDDMLLVQTESGDIVLVRATPEAHEEVGRINALSGKAWNNPALAFPYLVVRNHQEAACLLMPTEEPAQPE